MWRNKVIGPRPSPGRHDPPARGRPRSAKRGVGFTLVEILVVVAIAGIVIALAAVNLFPSDEEVARRESGYVALAIEKARDSAWFGGRPTAVSFEDGQLRQWRLGASRAWEPAAAGSRELGEVRVTGVFVDGTALRPKEPLVFLADGLGIPFRVTLEVRGLPRVIEGDVAGAVSVAER